MISLYFTRRSFATLRQHSPVYDLANWTLTGHFGKVGPMPRRIRDSRLETRAGRLRLRVSKKPSFMSIGRGLSVGYRRNRTAGTWIFRQSDGKGGFQTKAIGSADDFDETNGETILDFWQAQEKIKLLAQPDGARKSSVKKSLIGPPGYLAERRARPGRGAIES